MIRQQQEREREERIRQERAREERQRMSYYTRKPEKPHEVVECCICM
jgi:hypothetical protein